MTINSDLQYLESQKLINMKKKKVNTRLLFLYLRIPEHEPPSIEIKRQMISDLVYPQ